MDKPIRTVNSFKRLPKAPEPAKPTVQSLGLMKPGTTLTEIEKEGLKKLGIVADPSQLPKNIAEQIAAVVGKEPELPDLPPLKMPEAVQFDDIPTDKKKEILDFISSAKVQAAAPQQDQVVYSDPNLFKTPEIIDDLEKKEELPATPQPHVHSNSGLEDKDKISNCPHCGWDLKKSDDVVVSDDDKINFVQSILGSVRFKKAYQLFGGRITIVFRTLTVAESDMAYKQLIVDSNNDIQSRIISDTMFYWRTLMAYKAVMSVERIESEAGVLQIDPIMDIEVDPSEYKKPNTKLFALFDDLVEQIMPSDVMRNAVSNCYNQFNSLVEKMQAMAEDKDFWKAIK
jgi:hypothetical protein